MFDADRPIQNSTQDRLNRTLFAKYLARCMLEEQNKDSLSIGLFGRWGVGKTSIINLVLEELNFAASNLEDPDKPIVLNFNAWSYSGQHQLIYSFFRRLSSALRCAPYLENADRIIYLLELYVSFFTHKPVPQALQITKKSSSWFGKQETAYAWESGRDLTQVKAELNELLRLQKHKIIIIIDNISRLYPEEIKQIFQIVKSMGDYTNTVYLLALDKAHVVKAIDRIDQGSGQDFIEKIVQLPFDVPPILQQDLEAILADKLTEIIKMIPAESWNVEYWADLYFKALKYCFKDCRDITAYVNALNFAYPRVRDVVNPVDFFALTAIEVFMPNVYSGIRDNKDLFTDLLEHVYVLDKETIERNKLRCEELLARSHLLPRNVLLELLMQLFPYVRHIYQPEVHFYHSDSLAHKYRRICSPDLFDAYFRLAMQANHLSEAEFKTLLAIASNPAEFDQVLSRLIQDGRIVLFLTQLDSEVLTHLPKDHIPAIINALIDNGDLIPMGICGPLSLDTPTRIHRIIHALLRRYQQTEERFVLLQNAIANATKSIYISVHELTTQSLEHTDETDTYLPEEYRDLTSQQLTSLKQLTVNRIKNWAQSNRLLDYPYLKPVLFAWLSWSDEEECRAFVKKFVANDKGFLSFLTAMLDIEINQASTDYLKNSAWKEALAEIEIFIPIDELKVHAKLLFEDNYFEKLTEREQLALMIFLDLTHTPTTKAIPQTTV